MSTWVRVDTKFISHPKVLDIGPIGEALWLRGLCYAGEQLTDGFVPISFLKRMSDMKAMTIAERLVDAGLWDKADGGFVIHDYLDWQRSREEVADISQKRAEAGRLGGKQKASNVLAKRKQNPSKTLAYTDTDTDTAKTSPPVSPPRGSAKTTKTPVPDDLVGAIPEETWAKIKTEQKMSDAQMRVETERMRDHYQGKGERMADWVATWRKWMRSPYRKHEVDAEAIYREAFLNGAAEPPMIPKNGRW